jgi:HAD superfamily hydrolase (TIGR01509 family)
VAIKAVIFDCFGVLIVPAPVLLAHDYPDAVEDFRDLSMRSDYGYISRDEYNQMAAELTGLSAEEFQKKYWNNRSRNEPVFDWIKDLKKSNKFKVGMLSNISAWRLEDFIPKVERDQVFDSVVLSGEEGMIKPSAEIYELAASKMGLDVSECVMFDDLLINVDGAERAGMKAVLFGDVDQAIADFEQMLEAENA